MMCYSELLVQQELPLVGFQQELEFCVLRLDLDAPELLPDFPHGYLVISTNSEQVTRFDLVRENRPINSAA